MFVSATKDFEYDDELAVRIGQIFRLRGHRNDGLMLKHRLVIPLEPQPKKEAELSDYPQCGRCGARFLEIWQRDRAGALHGQQPEARPAVAREDVTDRVTELRRRGLL